MNKRDLLYRPRWHILIRQSLQDLRLWVTLLIVQFLWHTVYFLIVADKVVTPPNLKEATSLLLNSFLFDNRTSGFLVLISWLFISIPSSLIGYDAWAIKLRTSLLLLIWFLLCFANLGQIGYFFEYQRTFDFNLFALVYDDFGSILATIEQEYHLLLYLLLLLFLLLSGSLLLLVVFNSNLLSFKFVQPSLPKNFFIRFSLGLVIILTTLSFITLSMRGSFGIEPLQYKNISVSRDSLLNESVLNPINAFYEAYDKHRKTLGLQGMNSFTNKSIRQVTEEMFPKIKGETLDDFVIQKVNSSAVKKPRHIFLLIMESYSSWALLDKYRNLSITEGMHSLSEDSRGHLFLNFLPSSSGTMTSFASLLTGMQDVSVFTNYQRQSTKPYSTSLTEQFAKLGYTTRFFYGGSETWHDLGNFVRHQGIKELYTWPDITEVTDQYVWGIPDGELFDFVINKLDDSEPSLNIIMSVSYHPPYSLDLDKLGIDISDLDKKINRDYQQNVDAKALGHLRYADREMYRFITTMEDKLEDSLFVVTGDHHANNKHPLTKPPLYDTLSVPLLLYGSTLSDLAIDTNQPGTHLDIAATLLSLATKPGSTYYSLGDNLLATDKPYAISSRAVISRNFIARIGELPKAQTLAKGNKISIDNQLAKQIQQRYNDIGAYSWWRIVKGNQIPP